MRTNYKQLATNMIKSTARSEASVVTQWGDVAPLTSWVEEFPAVKVPDPARLERALDLALMKLTRSGLRNPQGVPFGGLKLQKSPTDTWLLSLYSQFDTNLVENTAKQGAVENDTGL
jgi:hypothetical protein